MEKAKSLGPPFYSHIKKNESGHTYIYTINIHKFNSHPKLRSLTVHHLVVYSHSFPLSLVQKDLATKSISGTSENKATQESSSEVTTRNVSPLQVKVNSANCD